jgi:hypothetical protein
LILGWVFILLVFFIFFFFSWRRRREELTRADVDWAGGIPNSTIYPPGDDSRLSVEGRVGCEHPEGETSWGILFHESWRKSQRCETW